MIKKRVEILALSIISTIFSYFIINYIVIEITVIQFIGIELVIGLLGYLQDKHKVKLLKP